MRMGLLDQPFLGVPGAIRALPRESFDTARCADILHTKADKFPRGTDLNVKETTPAAAAGFSALSHYAGFFRHRVCHLDRGHILKSIRCAVFDFGQNALGGRHAGSFYVRSDHLRAPILCGWH